ncbi:hypothetical protein LBWT_X2670 (plasmid) [Leptolyngbya boryana IAM M-101]|nr:hypothetical protein LBWT_X2670 [Leptolyngbya boryana IAM M-101]BAS66543.1 hypothetical protein LBDG_X2670 [Leptolyngbya boryana dg5]
MSYARTAHSPPSQPPAVHQLWFQLSLAQRQRLVAVLTEMMSAQITALEQEEHHES